MLMNLITIRHQIKN